MAKFQRGRNRLAKCRCCGKLTQSNFMGVADLRLCRVCNESALEQNSHEDVGHPIARPRFCPTCAGVQCLHGEP